MWARVRRLLFLAILGVAAGGCGTVPSLRTPTPVPAQASLSQPACVPCAEQTREIERLRQDVASRDAEVHDLRSTQLVQVKVLQESKREVTRAKVKLRRLATRADAASYIAEVEVAIDTVRSSAAVKSNDPQIVAAQRLLDSTSAPFPRGDYGAAIDRAAQAEQLIASAQLKASSRKTAVAAKRRGPTLGSARPKRNA
jgi:hypothetical protein